MKARWLVFMALVLALVATVGVIALWPNEPMYRGRTATEWLLMASFLPSAETTNALHHFGPDLLPVIASSLHRKDSALTKWGMEVDRNIDIIDLGWHTEWSLWHAGLKGIQTLGPNALPVLPDLLAVFTRYDSHVDVESAFVRLGSGALPELARFVQAGSGRAHDRFIVLTAMRRIIEEEGVDDPTRSLVITACRKAIQSPGDGLNRLYQSEAAANVLAAIGPPAEPATAELLPMLNGEYWGERVAAARALSRIQPQPDRIIPALIPLLNDWYGEVIQAGADALAELGPDARAAVPALTNCLGHGDTAVLLSVLGALREIGPDARPATDGIVRLLSRPNHEHEHVAVAVRIAGAAALPRINPVLEPALSSLSALLLDPEVPVRVQAAMSLGELGPVAARTVPELVAALETNGEFVQVTIVEALGKIGPDARSAEPHLRTALDNNQSALGPHVRLALQRMGLTNNLPATSH